MLTTEQLAAIAALRDKTVPGPWGVIRIDIEEGVTSFLIADSNDDRVASVDVAHEGDPEALAGAEADAHFIAEARAVVDLLLDEVTQLRAKLARTPPPRRRTWGDRLRLRNRADT
ncbi:hypothetical protein DDQ41_12610 [Streptomyces spongiicola]|uniref:DUF1876 domain-containing protein n=1 Tax=Streptomyces spongiicola TaxID=1690221 RepID=A0ABN5KH42_9ACTN|nr:hypothetical protein [Streptomyces spongiicola]AWK09627.1 hypothetical protein DDQ41_12610 [Streptomyces spongiicola]